MTSVRRVEADRAADLFYLMLAAIGAGASQSALQVWRSMPVTASGAAVRAWLGQALSMTMTHWRLAFRLAVAYYRLVRALRTGATIAEPGASGQVGSVTLGRLRDEFYFLLGPRGRAERARWRDGDSDRIVVERVHGLDEELIRLEREARQAASRSLLVRGPVLLGQKLRDVDMDAPGREVDGERAEAHREAGVAQAVAAERIVRNGARGTIGKFIQRDRRVIGWVRVSRTGTPCYWCAMLISRGPVYKSRESATGSTSPERDKYHDNCQCYAEPVYLREQYRDSTLFELNRKYEKEWPKATAGFSGRDAVRAWRRYYDKHYGRARVARN